MYMDAGGDETDLPTPEENADYLTFFKTAKAQAVYALLAKKGECSIKDIPEPAKYVLNGMKGALNRQNKPHSIKFTREGRVFLKRQAPN